MEAKIDGRKGRVVELRYFGGLSVEETAQVLGISPETAKRDWKMAKAWLFGELSAGKDPRVVLGRRGKTCIPVGSPVRTAMVNWDAGSKK
jgi:hypothetical protein